MHPKDTEFFISNPEARAKANAPTKASPAPVVSIALTMGALTLLIDPSEFLLVGVLTLQ